VKAVWTAAALLAALLLQSALSRIAPGQTRILDPFLLVVVYCALVGGETRGMLTGLAAGWLQDVHFGGPVVGLSGLTKVVVGFGVGAAASRFLLGGPGSRVLVLFAAALADTLLFERLAAAFEISVHPLSPLAVLTRAGLNALLGGPLYELLDRRVIREARG
jgi:rod shape-determining protein MreD